MKSSLFYPGTHLVCFVLTSYYKSSFISFCFLSLDISIGVCLPCPWSKPISHSLDVYQCLITESLAVFGYRIYSFRLLCPWFEMSLYTYLGSISFRYCLPVVWDQQVLWEHAHSTLCYGSSFTSLPVRENPVFRPGTRSRKFCSSSIVESSFISFSVISLDIYQCLYWAFSNFRLLHF